MYAFDRPAEFSKQDSGTADAPIVYKASPAGEVRFTAGRSVDRWTDHVDPNVQKQLPESSRGHGP